MKLTPEEITCINHVKDNEKAVMEMVRILSQINAFDVNPRMLEIGKMNIEQGFMWLVKAIAKPE